MSITIITFNNNNIIREVFLNYEDEEEFLTNLTDWQINSYDYINVSYENYKEIMNNYDFEDEDLKEKFINFFENTKN